MPPWRDVGSAALVAGSLSGAPSTVHALATGQSPLAAARAAGELLGRPGVARGLVAHAAVSAFWAAVLTAVLPRGREIPAGAAAGVAIAALDLGVIARRRFPAIAALPPVPQLADHVAFGALVGATLAARRRSREGSGGSARVGQVRSMIDRWHPTLRRCPSLTESLR